MFRIRNAYISRAGSLIVFGYILVAVWITTTGDIQGEAVDYFYSESDCWEAVAYEWENRTIGESFTCIAEGVNETP